MKKNIPRLYQSVDLAVGSRVTLSPNAFRHAVKSLRLRESDEIILFNGQGGEYRATLVSVKRDAADVTIDAFEAVSRELNLSIHLGQCLSRSERMDYAIQKSVEVGVTEITPLIAERCQFKLPSERLAKRLAHWQQIIISACEQSGRTCVPVLNMPQPLAAWVATTTGERLVCDGAVSSSIQYEAVQNNTISLLVGPEGGLTVSELELSYQHGFTGFSLGSRTLRTETAPIVAITLLQNSSNRI